MATSTEASSRLLFGYVLALPWVLRSAALYAAAAVPSPADLRGFLSDATWASLFWAALIAARRWLGRGGAVLVVSAWVVVCVASFEQVRALGSPLTLGYAKYLADPTFLLGSALSSGTLILLLPCLALGTFLVWRGLPEALPTRRMLVPFLGGLVGTVLLLAVPARPDAQAWRQALVRIAAGSQEAVERPRAYRRADLSGSRWAGPLDESPDVLLLVLEGVPGAALPTLASAHGRSDPLVLTRLDQLASTGVSASAFVTEQRQTNRGLYALLCGQSPRIAGGEARMTEIARGLPHPPCLPELLASVGYRTVFFEATPLSFMLMDGAMPRIGFERVLDDSRFTKAGVRNRWGVDDATFLRGLAELLESLDGEERPWFVTALTAGTHHPYDAVPEGFSSPYSPRTLAHSAAYLDQAVGELWQDLERRTRDRGLVSIVVSDESAGASGRMADVDRELAQNWGVLVVHAPGLSPRRIEEPVLQSDVALSLLDLLGLAGSPGPGGRSLFRTYTEGRPVAFGNTYQGRVSAFGPGGFLVRCAESRTDCRGFRSVRGTLFGGRWAPAEAPASLMRFLAAEIRASSGAVAEGRDRGEYRLVTPVPLPVPSDGQRMLFGGQYLDVPPGRRVSVDLSATVEGGSGWLHLRHALSSGAGFHYLSDLPALAPGDSFRLRYSFRSDRALESVDARMMANRLEGDDLAVLFDRATIQVRREPGESTPTEVEERSVVRAATPPVLTFSIQSSLEDLELPPGMERREERIVWPAVEPGRVVPGPAFYAPPGSTLRARARVRGTTGECVLRLIVGSEDPSLVLAGSAPTRVGESEAIELSLEHQLAAILPEVASGVLVERASPGAGLVLEELEILVSLP